MLLAVANVTKSYGPDRILEGVSFRLEAREKVALVGRNGAGKTTLLKILTGREAPDTGTVGFARGVKVGYLRQEMPVTLGRTVLEEAKIALEAQLAARDRLAELEVILEAGTPTEDDLEEYARLHEHFLDAEGYRAENDLRAVLLRMGFTEDEFDRPTDRLSGGEKTRLALARLLLEEPDLLILDEPTNHLDLQATEWLESWLRRYHGAVLLVSHDRTFLENTADRVLEMKSGTVEAWPGPFEKFLRLKAERDARLAEVARQQDREIAKMDEYVRRFMNSQRTAQARGRQKLMNRLIENRVEVTKKDAQMKGGFGDAKRSGDQVIVCEKLKVGFTVADNGGRSPSMADHRSEPSSANAGDREQSSAVLIPALDWTVRRGERWGVIGENGAGKSTLVKTVLGEIEPLGGRARIGAAVELGYFTQDHSDLDPEMSPLDAMVWDLDLKPNEARDLLGRFLIAGDDVYRPIRTLSGGEKNKLSLARLTHLAPNLLVLDEPTNHLDMDSREALANVLRGYEGTLVLVSHDRYLLSLVTDRILDLRRDRQIQYPGGYSDYRAGRVVAEPNSKAAAPKKSAPEPPKEPTLSPREVSKLIGQTERELATAETRVTEAEAAIAETEARLANLRPHDDVTALSKRHHELTASLDGLVDAWSAVGDRLEELRAMQGG